MLLFEEDGDRKGSSWEVVSMVLSGLHKTRSLFFYFDSALDHGCSYLDKPERLLVDIEEDFAHKFCMMVSRCPEIRLLSNIQSFLRIQYMIPSFLVLSILNPKP